MKVKCEDCIHFEVCAYVSYQLGVCSSYDKSVVRCKDCKNWTVDGVGKRKLKAEIVRLTYRVDELEERLCPCNDHHWKKIDMDFVGGTGRGDEETVYTYKCKRCGKSLRTWKPFLEKEADSNG